MISVSAIIPNYNHTRYLGEAIQSALNQKYPCTEIIVVDDGSTDNCREVVAGFGERVRYIWQENLGLAGARNTGIRAAGCEFLALLDADDQWRPDYLANMTSLIQRKQDAVVYYCSAQAMDANGLDLPQVLGGPARPSETIYRELLRADFLIPSTIVMRRSVVMAAGLFDESLRFYEDWDLWLRLLPLHAFAGISDCLVRYRLHGGTLSTDPIGNQKAARSIVEKHFGPDDGLREHWPMEKRLAWGGVYRYCLLTSIQRQDDWRAAGSYLAQALRADPTLSADLDLFYDLALGAQPAGYRGSPDHLDLDKNAKQIENMLRDLLGPGSDADLRAIRHRICGTAYYGIGLVAYNVGRNALCRTYSLKALRNRPDLWREARLTGNLIKLLMPRPVRKRMKKYRTRFRR